MIATPQDLPRYRKAIRRALADPFLRRALAAFASAYPASREKAFSGLDFSALSADVVSRKDAALSDLEGLYETFKERAEAHGVVVHRARSAAEANEIISRIARENGVRRIVKAKSMTAEETHLNDHLQDDGFEVTETDLGEWIIQLRHEGPSHMVLPAIHLSRGQVAELFTHVTGEPQDPDDITRMVRVARRELRPRYFEAGMGVTGANFAIAETGTVGMVTNEGNLGLVTTLPRVHVALFGFEKLVPDLASALAILRVLPRNATGQVMSSYVTWITGRTECKSAPDGRRATHFVVLDNGRLALARDPVFSQALRCIRCGACANVCPAYRMVGGHQYGHVYIGAIGLILTYFYHGRKNARAIVQNCLNCQRCKAFCPSGIDLPALIKETHRRIIAEEGKPLKNRALARVLKNRRLFHGLLRAAAALQGPVTGGGPYLRHLPEVLMGAHGFRTLPALSDVPLRDRWASLAPRVEHPEHRAALFAGCLVDFVYPEQAEAMLRCFSGHGVSVAFPEGQTCCGLPVMMAGEREAAIEVAKQNIRALETTPEGCVVVLCASCGSHMRENYPALFADDPAWAKRAGRLAERIVDFSSYMTEVLKVSPEEFYGGGQRVAYHAPCHLCRGLGVTKAPKDLLARAGLDYAPAPDEDTCCGFGGSYSMTFPELSGEILSRKLGLAEATGATVLATDCPGCVLQLDGGLARRGSRLRARHIAEVVAEGKRPEPRRADEDS